MPTKTKKATKYHYFMEFRKGDYFEITRGLEKKWPATFMGCGVGCGGIDVHFFCTAKKMKLIKEFAVRNYGKLSVHRYTDDEYLGEVK